MWANRSLSWWQQQEILWEWKDCCDLCGLRGNYVSRGVPDLPSPDHHDHHQHHHQHHHHHSYITVMIMIIIYYVSRGVPDPSLLLPSSSLIAIFMIRVLLIIILTFACG